MTGYFQWCYKPCENSESFPGIFALSKVNTGEKEMGKDDFWDS